ncbi:MAG: M16 family metallopeptidase [Methyloligellaceae bacterium]
MTVQTAVSDNGLRVVTHHMPHLETVSLGLWVNVGTRSEGPHEHGISHFLEHMAFKGTPTRSARQIAEEIESVGGELNAATSLETTAYYARILKEDAGLALSILSDILQNALFDDTEMAREREVILQEIAAALDSPDEVAYDLAQEVAFPDQALGRPILGSTESVSSFVPAELRNYLKTHYQAGGIVVSAAGAVDHDAMVAQASAQFSSLNGHASKSSNAARYQGGIMTSERQFEQSHIILAFEGLPYLEQDFYISQVFSGIFGGGMSSRLFQEVRERRGLCYSIYSFSWGLVDTGLFGVHAATGPEQIPELMDVVTNELIKMAERGPDAAELARSKAQLKAGLLMSLESSGARAEQLARQMLAFGRPLPIEELIERVETVNCEGIRQLVERLISGSMPTLSGVGSLGSLESYDKLAERFR